MFPLPQTLHPAVVHFPIVLILFGAIAAIAAAVTRRWHLPAFAAVLLATGALGAIVATSTGGEDEEMAGELSEQAEETLEEHEEWGETTRNLAIVTALLALGSAGIGRWRTPARVTGAVAAVAALATAYAVVQTGHYGGELVYRYGAGVTAAIAENSNAEPESDRHGQENHHDDDD